MDRFFHSTDMDTGSIKQMEDIFRHQSFPHSSRNRSSDMETCTISIQYCWSHIIMNWTYGTVNVHTMVEGTTVAFTGAIQLSYNRGQHSHTQPRNQKCAFYTSTTSRRHDTKMLQIEQTHQSYCLLQKIHTQLQTSQCNHSLHTRSWPSRDLLCEDGTTNLLWIRNDGLYRTTRGFN